MGCKRDEGVDRRLEEVTTTCEDEPMCRQTTVPSSEQARQKGSQCSLWSEG